jgi:hypothetical protein
MTSIWLKDPSQNQRVAQALWNHHYANVSGIYYMTNTNGQYAYKMAGCASCSPDLQKTYAYLLSTEAGPNGEDIAILLRENTGNSGLPTMYGRHGGADWGSQHVTLIMSGPGVAPGVSHHPARIVDIAPTIERFMGITPQARDGLVLADAFQNPNPGDEAAQAKSDVLQNVYVNALSQRAQSDLKLEAEGKIPNTVPADDALPQTQHHLPVTIAGVLVLLAGLITLSFALKEAIRQRSGFQRVD